MKDYIMNNLLKFILCCCGCLCCGNADATCGQRQQNIKQNFVRVERVEKVKFQPVQQNYVVQQQLVPVQQLNNHNNYVQVEQLNTQYSYVPEVQNVVVEQVKIRSVEREKQRKGAIETLVQNVRDRRSERLLERVVQLQKQNAH